jgi:DNA repair exonuclease SbcCD ATPase subunit
MLNQNQNTTTATAAYIDYKACDIAAAVALRAKHQKSGLQFIADLQNQRAADRAAANLTAYAEEVATLERKRADLYQTADTLQAHADKLTTPAEEARAAASAAAEARRAAKKLTPRIDQLNALFSLTLSDRADIVQAAALEAITRAADPAEVTEEALTRAAAQIEAWTAEAEEAAKDSRTAYAAHNAAASALVFLEALDPEEVAQDTANYKATITAAGRAISAHAAPEALNRYTTKATQATPEEVEQWVNM